MESMIRAKRFIWLGWVGVLCMSLLGWGCGGGDVCGNDADCKDGKVCVGKKCIVLVEPTKEGGGSDAGEAVTESAPKDEAVVETKPEAGPEPKPEAKPEAAPDKGEEPGQRKANDPCDPRVGAYARDRCGPGFGCAELGQTNPQSGAPQPYGICLPSCDPAKSGECPSGTVCTETYDTKTRQPTKIFVCAAESAEGDTCVNDRGCKQGLSCIRYGTTGTFWICQKDCTADEKVCESAQVCMAKAAGDAQKVCKDKAAQGEVCGASKDCEDGSTCVSGNPYGAFSATCMKKCQPGSSGGCDASEVCQQTSAQGQPVQGACFKKVGKGEECYRGRFCETGMLCLSLTTSYAACYKRCTNAQDCDAGETCATYSSQSATKVCRKEIGAGEVTYSLASCRQGTRGIAFAQGEAAVCLADCTRTGSTGTDVTLCGKIGPNPYWAVAWTDQSLIAVGEQAAFATSADDGKTWTRENLTTRASLYSLGTSGDGKVVVAVGGMGAILRSEDGGKTFSAVTLNPTVDVDLLGVSVSTDGMLVVAVGAKGTVLRSEDGGKTFSAVTLTPAVTGALRGVAIGRDTGGTTADPMVLIVGDAAKVLRSEDAGKTFSEVTVTGATGSLNGVAFVRDRSATGLGALAVGATGQIYKSEDDGKAWTKETSNVTGTLRAVAFDGTTAIAVGAKGTIARLDAGTWGAITGAGTTNLNNVAIKGQNVVVVGFLGSAYHSADAGKTFAATSSSLMQCIAVTRSGAAAGGACLYICDPAKKGADCPPQLQNCAELNLQSGAINICRAGGATPPGTATQGSECSLYPDVPDDKRCLKDHVCVRFGSGPKCLRTCDPKAPQCDGNAKCNYVIQLRGYYCGGTAKAGEECDLEKSSFCEDGTICRANSATGKSTCETIDLAKELDFCTTTLNRTCAAGLTCIGISSSPYRRFCARECTPGTTGTGCDPGWDCLGTSGGGGVCIEKCATAQHTCKIQGLTCQRVTQTGGPHCL